jgi:hypothetical protein
LLAQRARFDARDPEERVPMNLSRPHGWGRSFCSRRSRWLGTTGSLRLTGLLIVLATLAWLPAPARAQTGAASFTGIITDQGGAALPGVTITATNQSTQVPYTAVTNSAGVYTLTPLPIGPYIVKADMSGFASKVTNAVTLEAGQIARLNFSLDVTGVKEQVEVVASAPVLQTESATVGEVISGTTVVGLPLNGRNPGSFALLLAGVTTPNPSSFTTPSKAFSGGRPYVNGQREQSNNYTLDGVDMNESIDNLVAYQPSPDALAEISVETNNYSAELGNVSGAIINNVIKSGTNQLHGNIFEFLRNSSMDANTWVNNRSHAVKPPRDQNIYGGTVGGPIITNKVFFFADYQGLNLGEPSTVLGTGNVASVAPASWRGGDLSSLLAKGVTIKDPTTGLPFPGNIIPANRIGPVARALLADTAAYPLPTVAGTDVANNFVGTTHRTTKNHQLDGKVDWNLSNENRFFVRYSYDWYKALDDQTNFPLIIGGENRAPFKGLAVNWNRIISPAVINELLFGYTDVGFVSDVIDSGGIGNANGKYGIGGDQPIPGLSQIILSGAGLTNLGTPASTSDTDDKTLQINEKLSWINGRHLIKFGGSLLYYRQQRFYAGNNGALGLFEYTGAFTGSAFSDFLLDQVARKGRGSAATPPWTHLQDRVGLFAQDDFKLRDNLTLNLGFRWEYTSPLVEKDDRQANFDLTTGAELFANQNGNSRALYDPYYKGFEPRVGIAWTPTDKIVVRSAYGIVQHMEGTGANLRLPMNPPFFFESEVRYDSTTGPGTIATGFQGLQALDQASGQVRAFETDLRPQFNEQWNLFVEYLLDGSTSVNIGYVGNHSTHQATARDGNQPLPGTGDPATWLATQSRRPLFATAPLLTSISTTSSIGYSNYNALQVSARHRLSKGLEFLASYAFAKALGDSLGYYGSGGVAGPSAYAQNAYDQANEYGPIFFDVKHAFSLAGTYELPFGRGLKYGSNWGMLQDAALGGWSVSSIFQTHTGYPITVVDGRKPSLQASRGSERPNRIGSGEVSDPSLDHWLDLSAFVAAAPGTFGDAGVGILRAPSFTNLDLVASKRFQFDEHHFVTFKLEAFNVLNHPNFGPPARDISDPANFGRITSTVGNPRILELVFKFAF